MPRRLRAEVSDTALAGRPGADVPPLPEDRLDAALAALPEDQRTVVVLRHLLELTPGEIATAPGLPRGTVNSPLRRGLDALRRAAASSRRRGARS